MAVAGAQRIPAPPARDALGVLRLPDSPASVAVARRRVAWELAALGVSQALRDDVEVVVSELLGNAVRHARPIAGGAVLVAWRFAEGSVTVKVTDGGSPGAVRPLGSGVLAETGRGLRIVDGLASDWGVVDHLGGLRTVWAVLAATSSSTRGGGLRLGRPGPDGGRPGPDSGDRQRRRG